jgi:hypothetical protein
MNIREFKQQNPAYADVPESELIPALYNKFYKDKMSADEFAEIVTAEPVLTQQRQKSPDKFDDFNKLQSGILGAADVVTFGLADEIGAGIGSLIEGVPYKDALATQRQAFAEARGDNPYSYVAGQAVGGIGGAAGAARAMPALAKGVQNFAGQGILRGAATGGGLGAVQGGLYGAGSATGGPEERLQAGLSQTPTGALFGVGGYTAGKTILEPAIDAAGMAGSYAIGGVKSLTQRAKDALSKKFKPSTTNAGQVIKEIAPQQVALTTGEVLPLTRGQLTSNPKVQSLEGMARTGAVDDAAQNAMLRAEAQQQEAMRGVLQRAVGTDISEDALADASRAVKQSYKSIKSEVNRAYDNAESIRRVIVDKKPIVEEFAPRVRDIAYRQGFDFDNMTPETQKIIGQLDAPTFKDARVTGINLEKMEFWRRKLTNRSEQLKGDPEGVMLGRVRDEYDRFMGRLPQEALKSGDESALKAIEQARGLRRRMGVLFERDKVIKELVKNEELTNEELANMLIGGTKGAKNITAGSGRVLRNMKRAAGDKSEELAQNVRSGLFARIIDKAEVNTKVQGQDYLVLSPSNLLREIKTLNKNQTLLKEMFDEDGINSLRALQNDLQKMADIQPGARNYSNTAYTFIKFLNNLPGGGLGVGNAAKFVLEPAAKRAARKEVVKGLPEAIANAKASLGKNSKFYGAAAAGPLAAPQGQPVQTNEYGEPIIDITPTRQN